MQDGNKENPFSTTRTYGTFEKIALREVTFLGLCIVCLCTIHYTSLRG